jgi:hypothetical protein
MQQETGIFYRSWSGSYFEVFSNGVRLSTAKNLMQDNNFKGFNLKFSSIPAAKVVDNKIDITVSVKTTAKTFKMSKVGLDVNAAALKVPVVPKTDTTAVSTAKCCSRSK